MPQVVVAVFAGQSNSMLPLSVAGAMPFNTTAPFGKGAQGASGASAEVQFAR